MLFVVYRLAVLHTAFNSRYFTEIAIHQLVYHDNFASYLFDNNYTEERKVITVLTH